MKMAYNKIINELSVIGDGLDFYRHSITEHRFYCRLLDLPILIHSKKSTECKWSNSMCRHLANRPTLA